MPNQNRACCFSGHRDLKGIDLAELRLRLAEAIGSKICSGVDRFVCGGAVGFDTLAAEEVIKVKQKYPWVTLKLILPYRTFGQSRNAGIMGDVDEVEAVCEEYEPGCLHRRNRRMVEESRYLICYCREAKGGTAFTVREAEKLNLEVANLAEAFSD